MMVLGSLQVLFTFSVVAAAHPDRDAPLRFGIPLPLAQIEQGIALSGPSSAQFGWRLLQHHPGESVDHVWVECAIDPAPSGRYRLLGRPGQGSGSSLRVERTVNDAGITLKWPVSGVVDTMRRVREGAVFRTSFSPGWSARAVRMLPEGGAAWRQALVGVGLPKAKPGRAARSLRTELREAVASMRRAGGRARGDYLRGEGDAVVVTNLEFDTTLGFLRLAQSADPASNVRAALLERAYESAYHLLDQDLHVGSGLPYRHGRGHRTALPESGHVWVRGVLWTGCLFADEVLIEGALDVARALARKVSVGDVPKHARDVGAPLLELEDSLRFSAEPLLREACDRLGGDLLRRWDAGAGVFRFEEGEAATGSEAYKERLWQTASCVVPGFRRFVARTGSAEGRSILKALESRLLRLLRSGQPGLPMRYWVGVDGEVFGVLRREHSAAAAMVLEGLSPAGFKKAFARRQVQRSLRGMIDPDSLDLATEVSMLARLDWVYR